MNNKTVAMLAGAWLSFTTIFQWYMPNLMLIAISSAFLFWAVGKELKAQGKSLLGISWSALPGLEASIVAQFSDSTDYILVIVSLIFALWCVVGCSIIFRRSNPDSSLDDQTNEERVIKWGTEI